MWDYWGFTLQSNGKALINEMPLVAMKIDWGKIYSASDLLSQFDPHCRELHQANIQLDNTIMELMRQNPLGRSLFECIGGLEATDPKRAGNMYELLPFLLAKYLILEVSNNHHNKELFESAYNKLTFSGYLYDNYLLIEIVRRELIGKQEDAIIKPLKQFVQEKFEALNKRSDLSEDDRIAEKRKLIGQIRQLADQKDLWRSFLRQPTMHSPMLFAANVKYSDFEKFMEEHLQSPLSASVSHSHSPKPGRR